MNSHKNARTSYAGRKLLIERIAAMGLMPAAVDAELRARIERLRRGRMPMHAIARIVGRSVATISRVLGTLGLSSLKALDPAAPVMRYEHSAPGEVLHLDTKKLGVHRAAQSSRNWQPARFCRWSRLGGCPCRHRRSLTCTANRMGGDTCGMVVGYFSLLSFVTLAQGRPLRRERAGACSSGAAHERRAAGTVA